MITHGPASDSLNLSTTKAAFLSIDVVNSTKLKNNQTQQDIIYSFLSYHKLVSQACYHFQGQVMTISGDGLMCRFGPAANAMKAAQKILNDLPLFNKQQNRLSSPFAVRIGLHIGEVMESQAVGSGQIISHTLDVAGKLQQSAPPNHVRLSEEIVQGIDASTLRLEKIGWDASLQVQVFDYSGDHRTPHIARTVPHPFKVLLIENELDQTIQLKKILWSRRYEPLAVFTQDQAQLALAAWEPHMVIVSADLPWNQGWDVVRSMRQQESLSKIPLLVMSHNATGESIEKYFRAGANGFVSKPLQEEMVYQRVDTAIREFYL